MTVGHPYHHAVSSAKKYGGKPEDYQAIHNWFDGSKSFMADFRHRALRHHAEGIFMCESIFGTTITNSDGNQVPTRFIGEQHVKEDLGFIPSLQDWFSNLMPQPWMRRGADKLSQELATPVAKPERHQTVEDHQHGTGPTGHHGGHPQSGKNQPAEGDREVAGVGQEVQGGSPVCH